jgi:hypothetical protein
MSGLEADASPACGAVEGDAFARALADVDTRCCELASLLNRRELERVPSLFRSAVDDWLDARAAYDILASNEPPDSILLQATLRRLEAAHAVVHRLISRACMLSQRHAMLSDLEKICMILVVAAAAPSMEDVASTDV